MAFQSQATSANFQVRSHDARCSADIVAKSAEAQRAHLYWHWQEASQPADWTVPCQIVVHASRGSYLAAVGRGGERSFGSTWLDIRQGKSCGRRIDLLADSQGRLTALPHELTHVVVSDMLGNRTPPRWLDEGIAMLADSEEKQARHANDLAHARSAGLGFRAAELLSLDAYPAPSRVPAFYGQSAALTAFLARRDKPALLVKFAELAIDQGHDQALRTIYDIDGVAALEREWLNEAQPPARYSLARAGQQAVADNSPLPHAPAGY